MSTRINATRVHRHCRHHACSGRVPAGGADVPDARPPASSTPPPAPASRRRRRHRRGLRPRCQPSRGAGGGQSASELAVTVANTPLAGCGRMAQEPEGAVGGLHLLRPFRRALRVRPRPRDDRDLHDGGLHHQPRLLASGVRVSRATARSTINGRLRSCAGRHLRPCRRLTTTFDGVTVRIRILGPAACCRPDPAARRVWIATTAGSGALVPPRPVAAARRRHAALARAVHFAGMLHGEKQRLLVGRPGRPGQLGLTRPRGELERGARVRARRRDEKQPVVLERRVVRRCRHSGSPTRCR